jgi:hypothetical protein
VSPAKRSADGAGRAGTRLAERLDVLTEISALADGRVPPDVAVRAAGTTQRARGRLGHGAAHTVVALAGATGSGKSSLFNALAGRDLAATGVRRPTTSATQAAVFTTGPTLRADAAGLLSWSTPPSTVWCCSTFPTTTRPR